MKKWFWIGLPLVLLAALVVWRFKVKAANPMTGGPGGGGGGAAQGGGGGGGRPGGAGGPGGGAGGPGGMSRTPTVELAEAKAGEIESQLETVGSLESPNKANVAPKSSGRIEFIQVREGDEVSAGQTLVRIDPSDLEGQVAAARSNVAEARARLAQAQLGEGPTRANITGQIETQTASVASARADLDQTTRNYESQVQVAQSDVTDAEAKVRTANAQVTSANAALGRDKANLANAIAKRNRVEELYNSGFSSLAALEDARTAVQVQQGVVDVSLSQVEAAKESVNSANAQLQSRKEQLSIAKKKGQADIAAAKARLAQAQAGLRVATANRSNNPAYRENLLALQAGVSAAQAQLSQAQSRMLETSLKAPIAGIVTDRSADIGSLASPGTPLIVVQSIDWLIVRVSLPLDVLGKVRVGQTAKVSVDALKGESFQGAITNVNGAADPESRQITALIRLENPGRKLRPGMFSHVIIVTGKVDAAVTVPREAIRTTQQGSTIAVVDKDMKASVRPVKLGVQSDSMAEVLEGVKAGEKVVVLSYDNIREGQTVQLAGQGGPGGQGRGGGQGGGRGSSSGGGGERSRQGTSR